MSNMKTPLCYVSGQTILPKGAFGISPSNISKFFESPHSWYREQMLGEAGFTGSNASIIGTCTHYCGEMYAKTNTVPVDDIYKYIYKESCTTANEDTWDQLVTHPYADQDAREEAYTDFILAAQNKEEVDRFGNRIIDAAVILDQWKVMGQALITHLYTEGVPQRSEELIKGQVQVANLPAMITPVTGDETYWTSGSCDAMLQTGAGGTIIDYKTTSDKTPKNYIPMNYKYQLLAYAYMYRQMGIMVDRIQIIWVTRNVVDRYGKPSTKHPNGAKLKDYPSQAVAVTEQIKDSDMEFIESILKLISETAHTAIKHPELAYLLFKDYRLKL